MRERKTGRLPTPLSELGLHARFRMTPMDMEKARMGADQVQAAQRVALSIFTDMSNNGFSLQESLAAVYVSGLEHGVSVMKGTPNAH